MKATSRTVKATPQPPKPSTEELWARMREAARDDAFAEFSPDELRELLAERDRRTA